MNKASYKKYASKLKNYSNRKVKPDLKLNILEPRMFKIALKEMGTKEVVELWRTNNCCESVCEEMGISYRGIKPEKVKDYFYYYENISMPSDWDGDYIMGYVPGRFLTRLVKSILYYIKPTQKLAVWFPYGFLESQIRYIEIFSKNPFDLMLVTPNRPIISQDGDFSKAEDRAPNNGAWYIWQGTGMKESRIKWVEDELLDEYFLRQEGAIGYVSKSAYADTDSKGKYGKKWIKPPLIQID